MSRHFQNRQNIKAIILAGGRDFGRCPLASRLPTALWPIGDRSALERLLRYLSHQEITEAVVCSNGDDSLLQRSITGINSMRLKFLDEPLPVGTAGCIRDAADGDTNALLLVLPAAITSPPDLNMLLKTHRIGRADVTVMFSPGLRHGEQIRCVSEIYVCEPAVLKYIPTDGYYYIKESLIPAMVQAGKTVHAAVLSQPLGNFRDRAGYLDATADYLENANNVNIGFPCSKKDGAKALWLADSAKVARNIRIYGPVVVMDGATVSRNTIIFGPTIVGRGVTIGQNSLVENSVLWDRSTIGQNCEVRSCVVDYDALIPNNDIVANQAVVHPANLKSGGNKSVASVDIRAGRPHSSARMVINAMIAKLPRQVQSDKVALDVLKGLAIGILSAVFLWSYWPQLADLWSIWQRSDEYSSGLLVPLLALYILWSRRHKIIGIPIRPSIWGLFAFVAAQALRLFGLFFMYSSAERLSLVLSIAALVLFLFGWPVFRKTITMLLFLGLMLPLPRAVHSAIMLPLQSWATSSAVFCLEIMGYTVIREGNIIHLNDITVAVAEACNGLRMVTAFVVINGLVVLLVRRAWWEKLIVLLSSFPIALVCNAVRLTITAIAFTILSGDKWERIFHDFGGYAMMPLALAVVIIELWILMKLTTVPEEKPQEIIIRKSVN